MHNSGYARAHRLMSISILAEAAQTISFSLYITYTTLRDTGLCIFLSPTGSITASSAFILSKGLFPVFVIRKRHRIPPGGLYYQLLLSGKHSKDLDIVVLKQFTREFYLEIFNQKRLLFELIVHVTGIPLRPD